MKIGIAPVGYGHGFSRSLSNQGRALVNGTRVPVIGTVNMNSIALDLTEVEDASKGDTVTLIGYDGELDVSVASFSEASNQLNYELLTRLPMSIPRVVT
jgi:alanine racemase